MTSNYSVYSVMGASKLNFNLIVAAACYVQLNTPKTPTTIIYLYV